MNNRPARLTELFDEACAQRLHILEEPIGPIAFASITGCGPSIPTLGKMEVERRGAHAAETRPFALVAVGVHHQPPVPRRGYADGEFGALVRALAHCARIGGAGRSRSDGQHKQQHQQWLTKPHTIPESSEIKTPQRACCFATDILELEHLFREHRYRRPTADFISKTSRRSDDPAPFARLQIN